MPWSWPPKMWAWRASTAVGNEVSLMLLVEIPALPGEYVCCYLIIGQAIVAAADGIGFSSFLGITGKLLTVRWLIGDRWLAKCHAAKSSAKEAGRVSVLASVSVSITNTDTVRIQVSAP